MIELSLGEIAKIVSGKLLNAESSQITSAIPVINSNRASKGTFFVAFRGAHVDGHDFIGSALANGAEFALVSKESCGPVILVPDVLVALEVLAKSVRSELHNLTVIGVTGSQGKTTTKDLLKHILAISGETLAPEESLNNELGVPLLILRCTPTTKFCVVEMGARHLGDIAHLVEIAKPQIGVVLTVGRAHIGEFGSREIIAKAKSEIITGLSSGSTAILGNYDEFTPKMLVPSGVTKIIFGEKSDCNVRAADIEIREGRAHFDLVTPSGRAAVSLQLLGTHQISNALAAAAVATALSIPIESISAALSTAEIASKWRMEISEVEGITLINDSYNANPESMAAALRTLALISQESGGVSWAFLGKMQELGESSQAEHAAIGRLATDIGIDNLVCVSAEEYLADLSQVDEEEQLHYFENFESKEAAVQSLVKHFAPGDVVLVKASRSEEFNLLAELISTKLSEIKA